MEAVSDEQSSDPSAETADGTGAAATARNGRRPRARRARGTTESLLGIVLVLEAVVLFFVTLVVFGLKALPPALAFGGGIGFMVVLLLLAALQRYAVAVWVGALAQLALIATGILNPAMYVVGAGFTALWIYCLIRARQIERQHRLAAES